MTPVALDPNTTTPPPTPSADLLAEPTFEECIIDGNRFFEEQKAGRLDLRGVPDGHFIAYYDGRIQDHDADGYALQNRVAAALGVHWARVFVHYPWMW